MYYITRITESRPCSDRNKYDQILGKSQCITVLQLPENINKQMSGKPGKHFLEYRV